MNVTGTQHAPELVHDPFVLSLSKHPPARHEKSMNATGTPHAPEWCTDTIRPPWSAA